MALEHVLGPVIGPRRSDLHAAQVAAMIANVNRGPRQKAVELDDVALRFELPVVQPEGV